MKHKGTPSIKMDSTTFHSYRHLVWGINFMLLYGQEQIKSFTQI